MLPTIVQRVFLKLVTMTPQIWGYGTDYSTSYMMDTWYMVVCGNTWMSGLWYIIRKHNARNIV